VVIVLLRAFERSAQQTLDPVAVTVPGRLGRAGARIECSVPLLSTRSRGVVSPPPVLTVDELTTVYAAHGQAVFDTALHTWGSEVADEVTHRTFVRFCQHRLGGDLAECSLRAHLLTLSRQSAIEVLRSRQSAEADRERVLRRANAEGSTIDDVSINGTTRPAATVPDDVVRVEAALSRLDPLHRAVIVIVCWGGCTRREAANVSGVPLPVLDYRLGAALRALRPLLVADGTAGEVFGSFPVGE